MSSDWRSATVTRAALATSVQEVWIPAVFVVLWSTGFIGARLGLPHAGPLTFLALRYGLATVLLVVVALATGAPWPQQPAEARHYAVAGLLVHGVYLGGVFVGISLGVQAGVSALIVGLQPLLTAALAGVLLGERVTPEQWAGLGLLGVALVLARKLGQGPGDAVGGLSCVAALFGITLGTLYQKRYCAGMDLRTGNVVQFTAAGLVTAPLALLFEGFRVSWTGEFVFALLWLVLVLSLGAVSLLYLLIRRGAAAQVASLFFPRPALHRTHGVAAFRGAAGPFGPDRDGADRGGGGAGEPGAEQSPVAEPAGSPPRRLRPGSSRLPPDDDEAQCAGATRAATRPNRPDVVDGP